MSSLKTEFIKYLSDNYLKKICQDINNKLISMNEGGILLQIKIIDLSASDSDDIEFLFRLKLRCEVMTITGMSNIYVFYSDYSCILNNGISNFKLINIIDSSLCKTFAFKSALTDSFIPLNKKENYEKLATRFLKYYLSDDYKNYPINVLELVNCVGVTIQFSTNFRDSLGKTVFNDCVLQLTRENKLFNVKKGSIIINVKNLLMTGNNKLARTTIIHECLHWHYHKKAFEIIMLLNNKYRYFDCIDYKPDDSDPIITALAWMESQAYALTKVCMMLECNIRKIVGNTFIEVTNNKESRIEKADRFYSIVSFISDTFGTTLIDTIKRLSFLGYEEVEYLKNEYYDSKIDSVIESEKLNDNQTRRINQSIYDFLLENSQNLKLAIRSGLYIYVDGFVVINDSKYLNKIGNSYFLNTYARNHIEECSLIFNIKRDYKKVFNPADTIQLITANSGASNSILLISDTKQFIIAPFMIDSILSQKEPERSIILKNSYIYDDNKKFNDYFDELIKKYHFESVKELMEVTHCSRSVIENYRYYDDCGYSVEKVLCICAGMKLTPPEAKYLIKKSGVIDLESNCKRSKVYKRIINNFWDKGIDEWNKELKKENIPLLYKKK